MSDLTTIRHEIEACRNLLVTSHGWLGALADEDDCPEQVSEAWDHVGRALDDLRAAVEFLEQEPTDAS